MLQSVRTIDSPRLRWWFPAWIVIAAMIAWPAMGGFGSRIATAQSVGWLGDSSASYLASSGIPVMVPSWLPSPVSGSSPELYAGGGSYSIYLYAGGSFLYITGVAGAGFPGGSEANLNVPLSVNSSVLGYSAIHDLGIPEGSSTPIYDKVMWIADGVLYTVSGNGLDADIVSLANSSVVIRAATPPPSNQGGTTSGGSSSGSTGQASSPGSGAATNSTNTSSTSTGSSDTPASSSGTESTGATRPGSDGTGGAWFTGSSVFERASDGTSGAVPPFIGSGDGTGGAP